MKLFDFIIDKFPSPIYIQNVSIMYYGFDERCNQQLFTVSSKEFGVFGFIYEEVDIFDNERLAPANYNWVP